MRGRTISVLLALAVWLACATQRVYTVTMTEELDSPRSRREAKQRRFALIESVIMASGVATMVAAAIGFIPEQFDAKMVFLVGAIVCFYPRIIRLERTVGIK